MTDGTIKNNIMRWKLITWLTVQATNLSNILLSSRDWNYDMHDLAKMPSDSLGHGLYAYLNKANLSFKPNLIRHDIKHILLNYEMKMPDELKIHAFLIGNKNYNFMGIIYLMVCVVIVPEILPSLRKEYQRGKNAVCLKQVNLLQYVAMNTETVRQSLLIQ